MEETLIADHRSQVTVHQGQLVDLSSTVGKAIAVEVEKFNSIQATGTMGIDCIAMLVDIMVIIAAVAATIIVLITTRFVGLCSKAVATISFEFNHQATFEESKGSQGRH